MRSAKRARVCEPDKWSTSPTCHPSILKYLSTVDVVVKDGVTLWAGQRKRGITTGVLRARFYPRFRHIVRKKGHFSKKAGETSMRKLVQITKGKKFKRCNKFLQAALDYLDQEGHTLEACELPVPVGDKYGTYADLITQSPKGLHYWEIKLGYCYGSKSTQPEGRRMEAPLTHVPNHQLNQFHLQCRLTYDSMVKAGLPLQSYGLLRVTNTKKKLTPRFVHPPKWMLDLEDGQLLRLLVGNQETVQGTTQLKLAF